MPPSRGAKRKGSIWDHQKEFWSLVQKGRTRECWPWTGGCITAGYGEFKVEGRDHYTHRLAFEFFNLKAPKGFVLHSCDNPPCCNPAHLRDGNNGSNMADRAHAGNQRGPYGGPVVNPRIVKTIRAMVRGGVNQKAVCTLFGLSAERVSSIVLRRSWKCID